MTSRTEYCTQTPNKPSLFDVQYLRNRRTSDIGVLGYIGIVWPKEHSPEVRSFPTGTPCIMKTISPGPRHKYMFRNNAILYGEELLILVCRTTPKMEDHPLSAVRDCLLNIFAATLHIGGRFFIRNMRTRHAVARGTGGAQLWMG